MINNKQVLLRFKGIELLSKNLEPRPEPYNLSGDFHFDINADSKVNSNDKLLIVFVNITIREKDKPTSYGKIVVACAFEVQNFEESILKIDENLYHIPSDADALIKSVAISTTRGIMYSEFRGTYLYNAILPIIILSPGEDASAKKSPIVQKKKAQRK